MSPHARPPRYISGILVTPRIAYLLERRGNLTDLRTRLRGDDEELDATLHAIRWAALQWATSVDGSEPRKATEATVNWYSPAQAANQTGLTEHAIRLAIREGRLPARKVDGRWHISPADYAAFIRAPR